MHNQEYSTQHDSCSDLMEKSKARVRKIQHHQTRFMRNAKGTSLGRKHKRKKKLTQNKPQTINDNRIMHVDNYFICKWIKCVNQKA